jgi:hypothetical protein
LALLRAFKPGLHITNNMVCLEPWELIPLQSTDNLLSGISYASHDLSLHSLQFPEWHRKLFLKWVYTLAVKPWHADNNLAKHVLHGLAVVAITVNFNKHFDAIQNGMQSIQRG